VGWTLSAEQHAMIDAALTERGNVEVNRVFE
jgi:hypothetical protein